MSRAWLVALLMSLTFGCTDGPAPAPPPPCDDKCKDGIGLRAMRETLKLGVQIT